MPVSQRVVRGTLWVIVDRARHLSRMPSHGIVRPSSSSRLALQSPGRDRALTLLERQTVGHVGDIRMVKELCFGNKP